MRLKPLRAAKGLTEQKELEESFSFKDETDEYESAIRMGVILFRREVKANEKKEARSSYHLRF
jgi:hypothetical protein